MSARTCGVGGEPLRRGSGSRVFVLGPEPGKIRAVIACPSCARRSVMIAVAPLSSEGARKSLVLDAAEKDVRGVLRALARKLRGLARGYGEHPHSLGLDQAAQIADSWAAEPATRKAAP